MFAILAPFALPAYPVDAARQLRPPAALTDFTLTWTDAAPVEIQLATMVTGTAKFKLDNETDGSHGFDIAVTEHPSDWTTIISPASPVTIKSGSSNKQDISVTITIPADTPPALYTLVLRATLRDGDKTRDNDISAETPFIVKVSNGTNAPGNAPAACPETKDPGGSSDTASLILVDREEAHGICKQGDEDWFKFGAVASKVYSIEITQMATGLDLSLELYDDQGIILNASDDNQTTGTITDLKPIITNFRASRDGLYFIRVRDTLGIGGSNRTYSIVVHSGSYGTVPDKIPPNPSVCNDKYEQDGLPELANLIASNETQKGHLMCPAGDSDWVKFFGLANYTYSITTSTAMYGSPEVGADTILYLFGRDGVTLLGSNNNMSGTLDSQILFTPTVDGFYYAQVKNVGDFGSQFIKYDLKLTVCLPGTCANLPANGSASTADQSIQASAPPAPVSTPVTNEPQFLPLSTPANAALPGFADLSFAQVWQRNDQPIAQQRAARSWMWGPKGWLARTESYVQADGGLRQVQYFDKGRMEINNPQGDRASPWFVSSGLLVNELITGKLQIGNTEFTLRSPANIAIAGDRDDPDAPTYASFAGVTDRYPGDRTGQIPGESIDRAGTVGSYTGPQRAETRLAHFVPQSRHNIPQVFWDFVNASGTVYEQGRYRAGPLMDWVFVLGYPISDAYWMRVRVGGVEKDVLVQAFERRVLTYTPDAPAGWQVQMGNVGRHYYEWRYSEPPPS
jgi:hypothetical protein